MDAWESAYATQGRLWGGAPFRIDSLPNDSRILELGCGSGNLLGALTGKGYDCLALDFSRRACMLARDTIRDPSVTLLTADARTIPLHSSCIDVTIAHHVAGHMTTEGRTTLFREVARVLRQGGRFIFCDFSEKDFRAGQGTEIEDHTFLRGNRIITHYFTEEEVRSLSGTLRVCNLTTVCRTMTVRGKSYTRAEVVASFARI